MCRATWLSGCRRSSRRCGKSLPLVPPNLDAARHLLPGADTSQVEYIYVTRALHVQQIRDAKADAYLNLCGTHSFSSPRCYAPLCGRL